MVLISKQLLNNILKKTYPAANIRHKQTDRQTTVTQSVIQYIDIGKFTFKIKKRAKRRTF